MLKKRLIATLIAQNGIIVQSISFKNYLPVGKPAIAIEFLNLWGIDEIILLDITASKNGIGPNFEMMQGITRSCFVPLTVGGGIRSINDIKRLQDFGADKISINSAALGEPKFITESANIFGSQCVIVSIDVVGSSPSEYRVFDAIKKCKTLLHPTDWAREVEARGAGEIYLTSVDRDGSKRGFDLHLIDLVAGCVNIPVIASGGAGHSGHILEAFQKTKASAISVANLFHFSEHSVITTKAFLANYNMDIRLNTHANYLASFFDENYRLKKNSDIYLEDLLFKKIEKEII